MRERRHQWHRQADGMPWIMGVLNCTPDSFSDGGQLEDIDSAMNLVRSMHKAGAAILDVGGESTRPGATAVPAAEELGRIMVLIDRLVGEKFYVSVDTSKPEVMRQALAAGVRMINDVHALASEESLAVVAEADCDLCLMHMQGTPESMQEHPRYDDVVSDVESFFRHRVQACVQAGIEESRIILDPGIGFGKSVEDNLRLLANIPEFRKLGFPVLIGLSRKSFLGKLTGTPVRDREIETAAAVSACVLSGVDIVRVHDVPVQARAIKVASAIHSYSMALPAKVS